MEGIGNLRQTPQTRSKKVVAFQNRNPIHRAHFELLVCAQMLGSIGTVGSEWTEPPEFKLCSEGLRTCVQGRGMC